MNPVSREAQSDPRHANRIVRAGRYHQRLPEGPRFRGVREQIGIEPVIRVLRHRSDPKLPLRPLIDPPCNAAREMSHQSASSVCGNEYSRSETNAKGSGFGPWFWRRNFRDRDERFGRDLIPIQFRVHSANQIRMGMAHFRNHLEDRLVTKV